MQPLVALSPYAHDIKSATKFESKAMSSIRTEFCFCTAVGFGKLSRIKQVMIQRFKQVMIQRFIPIQATLGHILREGSSKDVFIQGHFC